MKIKIIQIAAFGREFVNITPDSIHEVIEPPTKYKSKYPNSDGSVWVMGATEPVRIFINGKIKEAIILNDKTEQP